MTMLITKFHRLIRSKILWIGFCIVIVFSFVIWGTQMPETGSQGPSAAGELNGEEISLDEFQRARFNTYLAIALMSGRPIPITPEVEEQLVKMAWQRIATLREADRLGLRSSDSEMVNSVQSFEFLQENGRFSAELYDRFASQFLAQFRASKSIFEEHVREEIVLEKFRVLMDRFQVVTPLEVQRTFSTLTDNFEVEYALIEPRIVADDIEVTDEDIAAFFDKEPEAFTLPERVAVKAAVFHVADFKDQVTISDAEIEEYYDFNLGLYALPDETPADGENQFAVTATQYRPIEDVRDEIIATLKEKQAIFLAEAKANEFVQELSFNRRDGRNAFDRLASESGLEIIVTAPFSAQQVPPELDEASPAIVRAAFNLTDDDDYYYSDPVMGTNFVYVLALAERLEERVPELAEVRDQVVAAAQEFARYNALAAKAEEIRESAKAGLSAGLSFRDVMEEYGLTTVSPPEFTLNTAELDPMVSADLIRAILVLNQGDITSVLELDEGMLLGYVKTRTPNGEISLETLRAQIIANLRRQVGPVSFGDMQNYLLQRGNLDDYWRNRNNADGQNDQDENS